MRIYKGDFALWKIGRSFTIFKWNDEEKKYDAIFLVESRVELSNSALFALLDKFVEWYKELEKSENSTGDPLVHFSWDVVLWNGRRLRGKEPVNPGGEIEVEYRTSDEGD